MQAEKKKPILKTDEIATEDKSKEDEKATEKEKPKKEEAKDLGNSFFISDALCTK